MKCLDNICIKKRVPSGKSPARVPIKSSTIGSTSHCGTGNMEPQKFNEGASRMPKR